jgi:hypothetical protein
LLNKIRALGQEVAAMKVALRRSSLTRLTLLLLVLAFLAVSIWMFYNLAMRFGSKENLDRLAAKANERINQSAEPAMKQLQGLVDHCTPVLTKAFSDQAQADMPKYTEVLDAQRELLVKNLETRLGDRITARCEAAGERYEAILREEFPQVDDSELLVQMYASIEQIMEKLVAKYYSEQIRQEVEGVADSWDDFEMADLPAEGETPLEQEFLAELMQLGAYRLKGQTILIPSAE